MRLGRGAAGFYQRAYPQFLRQLGVLLFLTMRDPLPSREKKNVLDLCQSLDLQRLEGTIKKTVGLSSNAFFTGKTHKIHSTFRDVISERGT